MSESEYDPPVDEPPGKDGTQAPNPPDLKPVPEWGPGENPPGTNPPIPTPNTGTTPLPGMTPGVIVGQEEPPPAAGPPVNVDVPMITQDMGVLSCTMGNWQGEPTSYDYVWQLDGTTVGSNSADYTVVGADVGLTATCIVTATNAAGSTEAPPSNALIVA